VRCARWVPAFAGTNGRRTRFSPRASRSRTTAAARAPSPPSTSRDTPDRRFPPQ
jgi:hypothetical protein